MNPLKNGLTAEEDEIIKHRQNQHKAVKAVQHTAMTGDDIAGVFDHKIPFHGGSKKIAQLRGDGTQRGHN